MLRFKPKQPKPSLFNAIKRIGILEEAQADNRRLLKSLTKEIWIDHLRTTGAILGIVSYCGLVTFLLCR